MALLLIELKLELISVHRLIVKPLETGPEVAVDIWLAVPILRGNTSELPACALLNRVIIIVLHRLSEQVK